MSKMMFPALQMILEVAYLLVEIGGMLRRSYPYLYKKINKIT